MRTKTVIFRASPEFVERLKHRAKAQGLSKSEAIRRAVEGEAMDSETASDMREDFNPYARLRAAATGSLEAQRELARAGLDDAVLDGDTQSLMDGLCFARLAAAHGHEADARLLASMLALASHMLESEGQRDLQLQVRAEFIAFVAKLADEGLIHADENLADIVEASTPQEVEVGQYLRKMMAEA